MSGKVGFNFTGLNLWFGPDVFDWMKKNGSYTTKYGITFKHLDHLIQPDNKTEETEDKAEESGNKAEETEDKAEDSGNKTEESESEESETEEPISEFSEPGYNPNSQTFYYDNSFRGLRALNSENFKGFNEFMNNFELNRLAFGDLSEDFNSQIKSDVPPADIRFV